VKLQPSSAGIAAVAVTLAGFAGASGATPSVAATPPPTPPPISAPAATPTYGPEPIPLVGASATPIPIPSGFGLPGRPTPKPGDPTPSPPPNPRNGIEGVWEMVIQRDAQPEYVHFELKQNGTTLVGVYRDKNGKTYPLNGSVDGQHFRMIVTLPDGSALLEGRLDGTSDMVGKLTTPKEEAYFTASWRPKEKWIENVNAGPGGLGGIGGGGAGGAGGYPGSPP
jgi:hypothetical protein